ncbi:protein-tyrosine-phosphatase [Nannocystaceae bacterium ST9]
MPRLHRIAPLIAIASLACASPSEPERSREPTTSNDAMPTPTLALHPALSSYLDSLKPELAAIPDERRQTLDQIAAFVAAEHAAGRTAKLVFICTHNSRRSHMSQVWATVAAALHGIDRVEAYSGGTEATAFNPRAVAALRRAGFEIPEPAAGDNPHYSLGWASDRPPIEAFSKVYSAPTNPQAEFAAIMNCSEADDACPFVPGATLRISLAYDDPKQADGTPEEQARYDERSRQIAAEMLYLFAEVAELAEVAR